MQNHQDVVMKTNKLLTCLCAFPAGISGIFSILQYPNKLIPLYLVTGKPKLTASAMLSMFKV